MLGFFGQVWALCLASFLLGVLLNSLVHSLLITRPLRRQVKRLTIQLAELESALAQGPVVEPLPEPGYSSWPTEPAFRDNYEPMSYGESAAHPDRQPSAPAWEERFPQPIPNPSPQEITAAGDDSDGRRWSEVKIPSSPEIRQTPVSRGIDAIEMELSDPLPESSTTDHDSASPNEVTGPISAELIRRADQARRRTSGER